METSRVVAVAVSLALLLAAGTVGSVGSALGAEARVTLTDATVTPDTPAAGAPITAETTVRLSAGSNSSLRLDSVSIVDSDGERLGTATDLGRLSPGETLSVPVTFTVSDPGTYDLTLVANGTDVDGDAVRATRPLTVGVEQASPQVELRTDGLVAGADMQVQAVVSNPTTGQLRGITVVVTDPASGDRLRRTVPALAAGGASTLNFSVSGTAVGTANLTVETTYTTPTGAEAASAFTRQIPVEALDDDVGVRVEPASTGETQQQVAGGIAGLLGGGGGSALQQQSEEGDSSRRTLVDVTVTNFGNAPIDDVVLTARTRNGTLLSSVGRFAVADRLEPGASVTAQPSLAGVSGVQRIEFAAAYELGNGTRTDASVSYPFARAPGNATITGLDVTVDDDGRVRIDGNLANTGDGDVESAIVAVESSEYVEPAYPQRTYFVGTVGDSEFAPFELTAQADVANATSIPLRVVYTAGPERVTERVEVPMPAADGTDADRISLQSVGLVAGVAVGIAITISVPLWLRRRLGRKR